MISDLIINIIYGFLTLILTIFSTLGTVQIGGDFAQSIQNISSYVKSVDNFLPVSTLLAILAIEITIEVSLFTYKLIKWLYQKVPFIN